MSVSDEAIFTETLKKKKKILFATGNETKGKRFNDKLSKNDIEVITLKDIKLDVDEPEENGNNAIENALIKARYYYNITNMTTMAMDDNLYIENIPENLQPGMFVRRVNGKRLSDEEMIEYYSSLAKKFGDEKGRITARWIYGLALIVDGKEKTFTWSKEDFYIVSTPSKKINPGYPLNTISMNKRLNKYFTDITQEEKELIKEDDHEATDFIIKTLYIQNQKYNSSMDELYKKYLAESSENNGK